MRKQTVLNLASQVLRKEPLQAALLLVGLLGVFFQDVAFSDSTFMTSTLVPGTMPDGPYGYLGYGYGVRDAPSRDPGATGWQIEPWDRLISGMYQSGQLPLWNPHQGAGVPLAANMTAAPFFPLNAPLYVVPTDQWPYVKDLTLLAQLFLAGFFAFLFARSVGTGHIGALGTAAAIMFCGYFMFYLGLPHQRAEILIPALLYAFERLVSRRNSSSLLLCSAIVCFSVLGGMPEAFFLSFFFAGLYYIYRILDQMKEHGLSLSYVITALARAAVASGAGILLAAFLLLPFFEFLALSHYAHEPGSGVGFGHYRPATAISILVPYFLGGVTSTWDRPLGTTMYTVPYVGILPVSLGLLGLQRHKKGPRLSYFFAGFAVFYLLKAYGAPLVDWVGALPGFNVVIFEKYGSAEFAFSVSALAGLGLDRVYRGKASLRQALIGGGIVLAIVGAFVFYYGEAMIEYDAVSQVLTRAAVASLLILLFWAALLLPRVGLLKRAWQRARGPRAERTSAAGGGQWLAYAAEEGATRRVRCLKDRCLWLLVATSAAVLFASYWAGVLTLPSRSIDVGDQSDAGYVQGFHQPERNEWSTFRWTTGRSCVILPGLRKVPLQLRLVVNGWRAEDQAAPQARLVAQGHELAVFTAEREMRTYTFRYLPPVLPTPGDLVLEIHSDTFAPASDEAARTLGILVDSVEATPVLGPWWSADWVSIIALLTVIALTYMGVRAQGATPIRSFVSGLLLLLLLSVATILSVGQVVRCSLLLAVIAGLCYATLRTRAPKGSSGASTALLALLLIELFLYVPKERAQRYDPFTPPPYLQFLREDLEKYRVLGLDLVLYPNMASAYGVDDIMNLHEMQVGRYWVFIKRFICPNCVEHVHTQGQLVYDSKFLDLLGVRYVMTAYPIQNRWQRASLMRPLFLDGCQVTAPEAEAVPPPEAWAVGGETRDVLVQRPFSRTECRLMVPDGVTMLSLGVTVDPGQWETSELERRGTHLEVYVTDSAGQHKIFARYIDPGHNVADRRWHDAYLDLTSWQGSDVTIGFSVSPGPEENDDCCRVGWASLALVTRAGQLAELPQGAWTRWLPLSSLIDGDEDKWELVYDQEIRVYRNTHVLPRVFIVHKADVVEGEAAILSAMESPDFDPSRTVVLEEALPPKIVQALEAAPAADGSTARIVSYEPRRVSVEVVLENPGLLVLSDVYYPGWRALADGQGSKIYPADYLFRAVYLDSGQHKVEFVYDPLSYKAGLWLSLGTLLCMLVYVLVHRVRQARAKPTWETASLLARQSDASSRGWSLPED